MKENFKVKSKTTTTKEKKDESVIKYHAKLESIVEEGLTMDLHSDEPLEISIDDELELKLVKYQKKVE